VSRGYRECDYPGCHVNGGRVYIDLHETREHWQCRCGWVGALSSFPHHYGQARRFGHRSLVGHGPLRRVDRAG
jgi:hypothetical protein